MLTNEESTNNILQVMESTKAGLSRRRFLGYVGATSALLVTAAACKKHDTTSGSVDLGSGDTGILNYAYALEQLEAAFYIQVIATPYSGMTSQETAYLTDIRNHEVAHREFFKAAIGGSAIPALTPNFTSIDFTSRTSVLGTAKAFEDLGVSAYNGAGQLITSADYLLLAGKIVSVEARHAAAIHDLIATNTFADATVINAMGLDQAKMPNEVLATASVYIKESISYSNLPTS